MKRAILRTVSAVAALLAANEATAGVDVTTRTTPPGAEGRERSGRMRTQGPLLRIDLVAPPSGQGSSSLVFDAKAKVLRILRHDDRSYVEIDEATAADLGAKVAEARKTLDEQLAKMPPQQRAMMEKMMQGGTLPLARPEGAEKTAPLEASPSGATDTVGGKPCTVYTLRRGGDLRGDVCVASWDAVGLEPEDVSVVEDLGRFQRSMTRALAGSMPSAEQPFELLERVDGFPLRTRRVENGTILSETFFEGLSRVDVPDDAFAIPAGYTKQRLGAPSAR